MVIEIVITSYTFSGKVTNFGDSIIEIVNQSYYADKNTKIVRENREEIAIIQTSNKGCRLLENLILKHLTLDPEFALKLNLLDSINCDCLKDKTSIGKVLKDIMIDNYQLILTRKHWSLTNHLVLFFDAVDYNEADEFILKTINPYNQTIKKK